MAFVTLLVAVPGSVSGLCGGLLAALFLGVDRVVSEEAALAAGALLGAVTAGSLAFLFARIEGSKGRNPWTVAAGGGIAGMAAGATAGKALLPSLALWPMAGVISGGVAAAAAAWTLFLRARPRTVLAERERRILAGLDVLEAHRKETLSARELLASHGKPPAHAAAAVERALQSQEARRARMLGALGRVQLLRWGSALRALTAGFSDFDTTTCQERRRALAGLMAAGQEALQRWKENGTSASQPSKEVSLVLESLLEAFIRFDEALLVREVTLLTRPAGGEAIPEIPGVFLPDIDGLLDAAAAGLSEEERDRSREERIDAELARLADHTPVNGLLT